MSQELQQPWSSIDKIWQKRNMLQNFYLKVILIQYAELWDIGEVTKQDKSPFLKNVVLIDLALLYNYMLMLQVSNIGNNIVNYLYEHSQSDAMGYLCFWKKFYFA